MQRGRWFWISSLGWAAIIFGLSSIPGHSMPDIGWGLLQYDKLLHASVYAVLGALCCVALRQTRPMPKKRTVLLAASLAVAYGFTDEFHQLFVAGRAADLRDVMADGIGGLLGASLAVVFPLEAPRAAN